MTEIRDCAADYRRALIEEYHSAIVGNHTERAADIAGELRKLGGKVPSGVQRAVDPVPLEQVVPDDDAPKRRPGRPKKVIHV